MYCCEKKSVIFMSSCLTFHSVKSVQNKMWLKKKNLKGTVHSQITNTQSGWFWCGLLSVGDVCLLSNQMELDGPRFVVLTATKTMSLSRNHEPVTHDNPQSWFWAVSFSNNFLMISGRRHCRCSLPPFFFQYLCPLSFPWLSITKFTCTIYTGFCP